MDPVITLLLAVVTGIVSSYGTYYFAMRTKKEEAKIKAKEEKYLALLLLLQGFVGNTAKTETKRKFFREYYQAWLYSSDEVILVKKEIINGKTSRYQIALGAGC